MSEVIIKLVSIYFNTSFINLPLIAGKSTLLHLIAKLSGAQVLKFNPIHCPILYRICHIIKEI